MAEQNGGTSGFERLDRMEAMMETLIQDHLKFRDEHQFLLRAQVLLTDEMRQLAEAQKHTDERLNALIGIVDDLVRRDQRPQ